MSMIKNISKAEVLVLKDQVAYQEGQVVSKTLAQNDALSVTLFSFDKGEEISTHESGGDAFVTCLDGVGEITIDPGYRKAQDKRTHDRRGALGFGLPWPGSRNRILFRRGSRRRRNFRQPRFAPKGGKPFLQKVPCHRPLH